jgi:hypothetical protein
VPTGSTANNTVHQISKYRTAPVNQFTVGQTRSR